MTPLDGNEAFVGIMGVNSGYRRRDITTRLYRACEKVMEDRNISLYSELDAIQFYKSVGFKIGDQPSIVYFTSILPKRDILEGMFYIAIDNEETDLGIFSYALTVKYCWFHRKNSFFFNFLQKL